MKCKIVVYFFIIIGISSCSFNPPKEKKSTSTKIEPQLKEVNSSVEKDIVIFAKSQLGSPYRYGGIDSNGFDCSGFVYFVHKEALNKIIPRTSRDQSRYGYKINKNELQKGDLVFFDTSSKGHVNHSGIYIGDGKFIHSSSGKRRGVVISPLNSGFYQKNYKWARRIEN